MILDDEIQQMNANDSSYKTWKYNSAHLAALHIGRRWVTHWGYLFNILF
jgi:hypothetical protein